MRLKLLESAVVFADDTGLELVNEPFWHSQSLPAGSVVELLDPKPNPLLGAGKTDRYVAWKDLIDREWRGWIRPTVPVQETQSAVARPKGASPAYVLSPYDSVRWNALVGYRAGTAANIFAELVQLDSKHLRTIAYEFGKRPSKSGRKALLQHVGSLIIGRKCPMARATEMAEAEAPVKAARTKKRSKVAKAARAEKAETQRTSAAESCGSQVLELMPKNGTAKKLAAGDEVSHKALIELRDSIKAAALEARQNEKPKRATALSNVNRLVRKLARASA